MDSADSGVADSLERRVSAAIEEHELGGKRLLIAVSGGPDSLALLHALWRLRDGFRLTLRGAHLNHRLRAAESDEDAEFAANTFNRLGIPFTINSADVAAYRSRHKLSLEDAARRVRYAFLANASDRHAADSIALGHTADDQAESVLMHIIRGSGLDGLRGMQTMDRRSINGSAVTLFRPMLDVSRAETQAYCDALGLAPRIDASNLSPEFLRNRIRMELVPLLQRLNPSVRDAIMRLAQNATQDSDYIRARTDALWSDVARKEGSVVRLDTHSLRGRHPALQSRILRRAIEETGGEATQRHILDMTRLIGGAPGKTLRLSGGLTFITGYGEVHIGHAAAVEDALPSLPPIQGAHPLAAPGETRVGEWLIKASIEANAAGHNISPRTRSDGIELLPRANPASMGGWIGVSETLDLDCVGNGLHVRGRQAGDRFQPLGMRQSKSLRKFMVDARIPRRWRDGLPLIASERGIVCVPGWRIAHWVRVTAATRQTLRLEVSRER